MNPQQPPGARHGARQNWRSTALTVSAVVAAVASHIWLQLGTLLEKTGWTLVGMRTAFDHDQLGYMAIVANVANGTLSDVEPDTLTGINHYPRLYYSAVGLFARVTGLHPVAAWNLSGLIVQALLVGTLAASLAILTRRWWAAFAAPLPFILGTFAWTQSESSWYTSLESHAVIWGPFGVLFSLNGETAGLCLGTAALVAAATVWLRPTPARRRFLVSGAAALTIGLTANFQTYSFLTLVYVACYSLAAVVIWRRGSWVLAGTSIALAGLLFVVGPAFAGIAGQLPTLVLGLLPSAPGLILLVISARWRLVALAGLLAIAAAPQLIWTMSGVLGDDPFLSYRVASNVDLGVPIFAAASSGLGVLVPSVAVIAVAVLRRRKIELGIATGYLFASSMLIVNDRWGANAEPYRFWIDTFAIGAVLQMLLLASLLLPRRGDLTSEQSETDGDSPARTEGRRTRASAGTSSRGRLVAALGVVSLVSLTALALPDFLRFRSSEAMTNVWDPSTPREEAVRLAAVSAAGQAPGLVAAGPCVDARHMKITSAAPVAYYHLGMAWPERVEAVRRVLDGSGSGVLDMQAARDANVAWVVTDTACESSWDTSELAEVDRFGYDDAEIILWRLEPGSA